MRGYLKAPAHDIVLVPYLGQFDVLLVALLSRARGVPVAWDIFISLYDTVVRDRRLASPRSPIAWILYVCEWLAARLVTRPFLDTEAHARYFESLYRLRRGSVGSVVVGTDIRRPSCGSSGLAPRTFTILFYGQFIPLHGVDTIVRAARILEQRGERGIRWLLVGSGQEAAHVDTLIRELGVRSIERIGWIPSEDLPEVICAADICLGVFGTSQKAQRVIPNKVFEALALERPLVTANTPAVREFAAHHPAIRLVPPGDPNALADAVSAVRQQVLAQPPMPETPLLVDEHEVGRQLAELLG
jgi:glycosyltransferase involved in cell wall biosynthesis